MKSLLPYTPATDLERQHREFPNNFIPGAVQNMYYRWRYEHPEEIGNRVQSLLSISFMGVLTAVLSVVGIVILLWTKHLSPKNYACIGLLAVTTIGGILAYTFAVILRNGVRSATISKESFTNGVATWKATSVILVCVMTVILVLAHYDLNV